jgi:hypothetical protein
MTKLLCILTLLLSLPVFAQRDTLLGRVVVAQVNVPGVFVINKNTGAEAKTGSSGLFKIAARNGDKLIVYSDRTVVREFFISSASFVNMPYTLEVEPRGYELDEVVITNNLMAQDLGIVPKGQKHNTVAERRLYTAAGNRPLWQYALGLLAGSMPLDPFINAITGHTKKLKTELATEQKEENVLRVGSIYTEAQLVSYLKIPAEKVNGFIYYAAASPAVLNALNSNNPELAKVELTNLAVTYNTLQQEQNLIPQSNTAND